MAHHHPRRRKSRRTLRAPQFDAALSLQQVNDSEIAYNKTLGFRRRVMLAVLTRSRDQLVEGFGTGDGPDTLVESFEIIDEYINHLKVSIRLAKAAQARLLCTGIVIVDDE